jgi:hypothetical protein
MRAKKNRRYPAALCNLSVRNRCNTPPLLSEESYEYLDGYNGGQRHGRRFLTAVERRKLEGSRRSTENRTVPFP